MGTFVGPNIVRNNLVFYLDSNNYKSAKGQKSIILWDSWIANTSGSCTGYNQNGDGNTRVLDTNPFGNEDIVWQSLYNDVTSDADGGWNTTWFNVDSTKMYRFSTWVRRKVTGNGLFYLGTQGTPSVLNRSNGAVNTNPYFAPGYSSGIVSSDWRLFVGFVWPENSGTGSFHPDNGYYNTSGDRLGGLSYDFVWQTGTTQSYHRSYLFYSTDPSTNQQWYQPRVDIIDGTEPTITELINNIGNKSIDIKSNNYLPMSNVKYSVDSFGYYVFNGTDSVIDISTIDSLSAPSTMTISAWFNMTGGNGTYRCVLHKGDGAAVGTSRFWIGVSGANTLVATIGAYTAGGWNMGDTGESVTLDVWWNLTASWDGSIVRVYINGVYNKQYALASSDNAGVTKIGSATTNGLTYPVNGKISIVKILYDKYLTDDEVLQDFNSQKTRFGL